MSFLRKLIHKAKKRVQQKNEIKKINSFILQGFSEAIPTDYLHLPDKNCIDIITIAFNNDKVIRQQFRLIKKYLKDNFHYTIADNSSDTQKRKLIKAFCIENNITYLELPPNLYDISESSKSHGLSINSIYYNYIKPRQAEYFGIIDHDIFPIRNTQIIPLLDKSNLCGLKQTRDDKWYLWAGFCFYKKSFIADINLDFMPTPGLDTGGKNWDLLYYRIRPDTLPKFEHTYHNFREGTVHQSDRYEMIGDWMHTVNASYWLKVEDKDDIIENILNQY